MGLYMLVNLGDVAMQQDPYRSTSRFDLDDSNHESPELGMERLKALFPGAEADRDNFVLFSTSGTFGSYSTIEEIEETLRKYGDDPSEADQEGDSFVSPDLTVVVMKPRILSLQYGQVRVTLDEVDYLKRLRQSSHEAIAVIGMPKTL